MTPTTVNCVSALLAARPLESWIDPETIFVGAAAHEADVFWLDAGHDAVTGWSWLGCGSPAEIPARLACGEGEDERWGGFTGGWVGWCAYDAAAARAGAPSAESEAGDAWLAVDRFVAIDHERREAWAVAPEAEVDDYAALVHAWARTSVTPPAAAALATVVGRHDPREYAALIERCRDAIRAGDAYQLCLTTRFEVTASVPVDPVETYRRLRAAHPAHHGGIVRSGERALLSASPERFLEIGGGVVRTRPIKGTRPRGATPDDDERLARELAASQKERAENVMIVDLMRNDLHRVCVPGTVVVERLLEVESYPAVHQLVSTVAGRLASGITIGDVLDAAFPAGSMTGAPKLSAMTILHALERRPRGVFSGCFGWIGRDGAADLAMVIRSIVCERDRVYVGAGGGITWGSEAAAEVAEVGVKARGPLAALGASLPLGW